MKRCNPLPLTRKVPLKHTSFGMLMKERVFESGNYRYGFNSQEKDDEVAGSGNINTAEYWEYDTRLGRRWNVDPVVKEWESPFVCFNNSPILIKDPNGDDGYVDEDGKYLGNDGDEKSKNVRVIAKYKWDEIMTDKDETKKQGKTVYKKDGAATTEEDRKYLQSDVKIVNGQWTTGASKLLNEYDKGIRISDETWVKLAASSKKIDPYIKNNTSGTIYFKPEGNNEYLSNNGAYPVAPGKDIYYPIDGIAIKGVGHDGEVYKILNTGRATIADGGNISIVHDEKPGETEKNCETWNVRSNYNMCIKIILGDKSWDNLFNSTR